MMTPKMVVSSSAVDFQRKKLSETHANAKDAKGNYEKWSKQIESDQAAGCCTKESTRLQQRAKQEWELLQDHVWNAEWELKFYEGNALSKTNWAQL